MTLLINGFFIVTLAMFTRSRSPRLLPLLLLVGLAAIPRMFQQAKEAAAYKLCLNPIESIHPGTKRYIECRDSLSTQQYFAAYDPRP